MTDDRYPMSEDEEMEMMLSRALEAEGEVVVFERGADGIVREVETDG